MALANGTLTIDQEMLASIVTAAYALGKESVITALNLQVETADHAVTKVTVATTGCGQVTVEPAAESKFRTGAIMWPTLSAVDRFMTISFKEQTDG